MFDGHRVQISALDLHAVGPWSLTWGLNSDTELLGDYDGDGKTDFVAKRDVGGQIVWFIYQSSNGQVRYVYWGITGDK